MKEFQLSAGMMIRLATMDDLEQIAHMEEICFPKAEAATRESFQKRLAVFPNHFWLLEKDGEIVCGINGMTTNEMTLTDEMYDNPDMHDENGAWQMIFGVNTLPDYRRRGYAEMILRRVIKDAKAQGRKGVVLTCKDKLVHYYAKFGFENEGVSESVHGNVVWYQMRLKFDESDE